MGRNRPTNEVNPRHSVFTTNVKGISETLNFYVIRTVFKTKHTLRIWLMRREQKGVRNRRQAVSIEFFANVTEAALVKKPDCYPCGFGNRGKVSEMVLWKNTRMINGTTCS
jgi:hypothetical protein